MARGVRVMIGLAALGLGLAACGGGSSPPSTTTSQAGTTTSSSATTTTTASSTTSGSAGTSTSTSGTTAGSSAKAGIAVESSSYGQVLANAKGYTLYALSADTSTKSTCTGKCATIWPPLTMTAVPSFGQGVKQSLAGQVVRSDGGHQLTYGGHPLYTFKLDTAPHQTKGEGIQSFGGTWTVVSASTGKTVPKAGSSSSTSTTSSGGY